MSCVKRTRIRQIVMKPEDIENTAETLVADDVLALGIFDPSVSYDNPQVDRTPASGTLSKLTSISGARMGTITFQTDIKGSGSINTRPPVARLLEGCGFREHRRYLVTVNNIVGTLVYGATYTGGTSGAEVIFLHQYSTTSVAVAPLDSTGFTDTETFSGPNSSSFDINGISQPGTQDGFAYVPLSKPGKYVGAGAITSGPFVSGEKIVGGTSSAEGIVNGNYATGVTRVYYEEVSGTFQNAETVTGSVSGASFTSSTAATCAQPTQSLTMESREDGLIKKFKGCRGKVNFTFNNVGEPAQADYEFMGSPASNPTDGSQLANQDDSVTPPKFLGATLTFGSFTPVTSSLNINVNNTLSGRKDATDSSGYLGVLITDRTFEGSVSSEMTSVSDEDWHGDWFSDTVKSMNLVVGSVAGNIVEFVAPRMQYTSVGDGEEDGIAKGDVSYQLVQGPNAGDDDLLIMFY